jgi:hypothetical protein
MSRCRPGRRILSATRVYAPRRGAGERGAVTVEAAIALAALIVVVVLCLGALVAAVAQVRCVDAAREAARLAARGANGDALPTARRVAPPGADVSIRTDGDRVIAVVSARVPLLPLLRLRAEAVAAREPGESG